MSEIDDDFDENFDEEDKDAKLAEESESKKDDSNSLEKRRLIDNLLEEKRLARELEDFDEDDLDSLDDDDLDD
ncbi:hypothetical protein VH441_09355 [Psychrobacter sp. HD31]|uniref:PA3496 family putative envelope integrity protein n=1 Tax=Psychrobacter sp. HD31 TaxID=3112003 RepID=UPI003DA4E033